MRPRQHKHLQTKTRAHIVRQRERERERARYPPFLKNSTQDKKIKEINNCVRVCVCVSLGVGSSVLKKDFEKEINKLLTIIPRDRQTLLFSATMTSKVELKKFIKLDIVFRYLNT